jgi:intracellular septation protein
MLKKNLHLLKILFFDMLMIEFGPVAVFFLIYYLTGEDFPSAALSLGFATLAVLIISKVINKRVPWFALFSGSITIATAFVTFWFTAPWVLIVKDTVYYLFFGGLLGFSVWRTKSIFKAFFGHIFAIKDSGWSMLERRWCYFFIFAAISNELVRMYLSVNDWVIYKQIILVLFLVYGFYQLKVTVRHRLPEADKFGFRRLSSKQ